MRINSKYDFFLQLMKIIEGSVKSEPHKVVVNFDKTNHVKKTKNFTDLGDQFIKENKVKNK